MKKERNQIIFTLLVEMQDGKTTFKSLRDFHKLKHSLPHNPTISLKDIQSRKLKTYLHKILYINIYKFILCRIVKNWKQSICPWTCKWIFCDILLQYNTTKEKKKKE